MSELLEQQLREYGSFLEEQRDAVDVTAFEERATAERAADPGASRGRETEDEWADFDFDFDAEAARSTRWAGLRRPAIAAATLAAVAAPVAVALVLILSSQETDPPPRAEAGAEPAAQGPAGSGSVETPPLVASALTWSRVPHDEAVFGAYASLGGTVMAAVTAGGPGFVAVGEDGGVATVWSSVDGVRWSRVNHDDSLGGNVMTSVTVGGPGLVAVGFDVRFGPERARGYDAVVWVSSDGLSWSRRPDHELFDTSGGGSRPTGMFGVTAGGPGLVAVGADGDDAAVWTSVDGINWSRLPDPSGVFGGDGEQRMWSVSQGGPGLVAVGEDAGAAGVWTSVDGRRWTRAAVPETGASVLDSPQGQAEGMNSLTLGGPGLVAVGRDASGPAIWTSTDGLTWSRIPRDETVFSRAGGHIQTVTNTGTLLVAAGSNSQESTVWTSVDGITWSRTRLPITDGRSGDVYGATAAGPTIVVVGTENIAGNKAAVWTTASLAGDG